MTEQQYVRHLSTIEREGLELDLEKLDAKLVVPPRENAAVWEEGHPRNDALKQIEENGLAAWKKESGCHQRSLAENAMGHPFNTGQC